MRTFWTLLGTGALLLGSCRGERDRADDEEALLLNSVSRSYPRPAEEVWRAVQAAAKDLNLSVQEDHHDALGGNLRAKRANKDPVEVDARSVDAASTHVAVTVHPGDRNMAEIIHDRIAQKLSSPGATVQTLAGSSLEGTYDADLQRCVAAAQRAAEGLKLAVTHKEVHDTWARVESRQADTIPVHFLMERTRKDQTRVVFAAGTAASEDMRALAGRLKTEFERALP